MINQSDKDSSQVRSKTNSAYTRFNSNKFFMLSNQTSTNTLTSKRFNNPHRRQQIIISILLVLFSTLWVQITVQRHAPFIRTAQCFFNEAVFLHDSQDIYEGTDVIYWRNGQYYSFKDMQDMFLRLAQVSKGLEQDSFFQLNPHFIMDADSPQVQLLTVYKFDVPKTSHEYRTYNSSIDQMQTMLNTTLLNRTFYQHLWKIDLSIIVPLMYRDDQVLMEIEFEGEIFTSALMQFKMNVDILTTEQDIVNYGHSYSQNNLGVRKLNNNYDMGLSMPYIKWIVLVFFVFNLIFEMKFVLAKSKYIDEKVKRKLQEQHQMEKLLEKIDDKMDVKSNDSISSVGSIIAKKKQEEEEQYQLPISKKLQKIGYYFILEVVVTILALMSFVGNQNGMICFFAWAKIVVYLAQTKNRLMFGFLFEQTIPTYLRIYLNIILLITAFVLFNMLVLTTTKKFQTIELGYFEYFFNYFQYGIYENFIFAFYPFGSFAAIFYFIQIMLLLYVGNNILISILANQVSKNSYLSSVEEMIEKIRVHCPSCGVDFQESRKNSQRNNHSHPDKEVMVSKLMRDLQVQKMRSYSSMGSNIDGGEINILIKSPVLSPFFPAKNQKRLSQDEFLSPKLKNRKFQNQMKQIQQKIKKDEISSQSKLQAYEELKAKLQPNKKIQIELSDSRIEGERQSKYHKKLRTKIQLLYKKVEKFREMKKSEPKKKVGFSGQKFTQLKILMLNDLLRKVVLLEQKIHDKLTN